MYDYINNFINRLINNDKKICIIGDSMLDQYIFGKCVKVSAEVPIPVMKKTTVDYRFGGALNVLNNLISLNINTDIISIIGNDFSGKKILELLNNKNIGTDSMFIDESRKTTLKTRFFSEFHQMFRIDDEDTFEISKTIEQKILNYFSQNFKKYDLVIFSDYNKGLLSTTLVKTIINLCKQKNIPTIVDPCLNNYEKFCNCDFFKPNLIESEKISGINFKDLNSLDNIKESIFRKIQPKQLLITLGKLGMKYWDNDESIYVKCNHSNIVDVCGCGDTVISIIASGIVLGIKINDILNLTNFCVNITIKNLGTYPINLEDIIKNSSNLTNIQDLLKILNIIRGNNRVIFTNGCFDILHRGHIEFLNKMKCKYKNDLIIIALNSDTSIKKIKGNNRPILKENHRVASLLKMNVSNLILLFDQETPSDIINKIKPDIIVKGSKDYVTKNVVGNKIAKIDIISTEENFDTTQIVEIVTERYLKK